MTVRPGVIASPDDQLAFMVAGRAVFTVVSMRTAERFTYRVAFPREDREPLSRAPGESPPLFVSVLTGPDNRADYTYLGALFSVVPVRMPDRAAGGRVRRAVPFVYRRRRGEAARRSSIGDDAPSARAFDWLWRHLVEGGDGAQYEFFHEGRCGRCGRALTVPESLAVGIGPDCLEASGR